MLEGGEQEAYQPVALGEDAARFWEAVGETPTEFTLGLVDGGCVSDGGYEKVIGGEILETATMEVSR